MRNLEIPYTSETQDGRRKITTDQHDEVRAFYKWCKSQRKTAEHFGISRRLVVFILYPDRLKEIQRQRIEDKVHLKYYDKEKRRNYMRKWRLRKREQGFMLGKSKHTTLDKYAQPE